MKSATNSDTGPVVQVLAAAELFDPALAEDRDAVAHDQRLLLVVRDVQHRGAELTADADDLQLERLAELAVERAQRLVHQQQPRLEDDRSCERDPLLLAAGQLPRVPIAQVTRA